MSVCQIRRVQWYIILKTAVNYFILSYAKLKVYVCVCVYIYIYYYYYYYYYYYSMEQSPS